MPASALAPILMSFCVRSRSQFTSSIRPGSRSRCPEVADEIVEDRPPQLAQEHRARRPERRPRRRLRASPRSLSFRARAGRPTPPGDGAGLSRPGDPDRGRSSPVPAVRFVVRAEQLGTKTIIRGDGHGGGGVTLSWGTAQLAVEEALRTGQSSAAVLGCGAVGLATASLLQRHGWAVTIYARDLPPNTTSNIAGGQWFPSSVFDENRVTPALEAQYVRAARIAYRAFQDLASDAYGVRWLENYVVHRAPLMDGRLRQALADLTGHPGASAGRTSVRSYFRPTLHGHADRARDLSPCRAPGLHGRGRKGRACGEFTGVPEIIQLAEPIVVNCTGLGTKTLFGDEGCTRFEVSCASWFRRRRSTMS